MSAFHHACWEGDIERLAKQQRLHNPVFVDESDTIVKELLSSGRVSVPSAGGGRRGRSKKRCVWMEGTPAELAIRAGHFNCANLVLGVILYRWMKLSPWTNTRRCTKMIFTRKGNVMKDMLAFLGSRQWVHLKNFCKASWHCDVEKLHALLAACILGQAKVVKAILETTDLSYWGDIDTQIEEKPPKHPDDKPLFCHDLAATAAAMGGDAACVELVLDAFHGRVSQFTLQEAWICLLNPLWLWTVSQVSSCMDLVVKNPLFEGVQELSCDFEMICLFFWHLHSWFKKRDAVEEKYLHLAKPLPPNDEIVADLKIALPMAIGMIQHDCLAKLDISIFCKKVLDTAKELGPKSPLLTLLEDLLVHILTHEATANTLMGKDVALILSEFDQEQQQCFLTMLCQFMVVTRKHPPCEATSAVCPLRHPLISFISGVRKTYLSVLSEETLWTLGLYFSQQELKFALDILKKPCNPRMLCSTHAAEIRRGRYPLFGCLRKKAPRVLEVLEDVRVGVTLRQRCVMKVLNMLSGDHNRLKLIPMPGGLRSYFLLEGFLEKLCSQPQ